MKRILPGTASAATGPQRGGRVRFDGMVPAPLGTPPQAGALKTNSRMTGLDDAHGMRAMTLAAASRTAAAKVLLRPGTAAGDVLRSIATTCMPSRT
jgi:hypothetical protein